MIARFARRTGVSPVLAIAVVAAVGLVNFSAPGPAQAQEKKPPARPAKPAAARPGPAKPAAPKPAPAIPATIEVAKGDTLFRIAGRARHPGTTLHQTILALYKANPEAFLGGNINQVQVGRILTVPNAETVLAVDASQASQQVRALLAQPLVPVPAPALPPKEAAPPPKPRPELPKPVPPARPTAIAPDRAVERYEQALKLEREGDLKAAMQAYVEAGEAGYGIAQKRLGDIYNNGNALVARDYETALRWYQKARAQGVEIPKPITNPGKKP